MWIHQEATNLLNRLLLLFVLSAHLLDTARALSGKRLCADEHCKGIISQGYGTIKYNRGDERMMSFNMNAPIRIKSKNVGGDPSIWGIEVHGREGYAPKKFIRETKIITPEKDLVLVDVEQNNKEPVLSTSEKSVEQGSTSEAASTKPLNLTPTGSTEHLLNKVSNEKISAENLPAATPVLTEIVNGTNIPIFDNKVQSTNIKSDENEKQMQNIVEAVSEPVDKKEDEVKTSEISKEQIKTEERSASEGKKQDKSAEVVQENEAVLKETNTENAFKNEKTISKLTGELNKENIVEEKLKDNMSVGAKDVVSERLVEENTSLNNSDSAAKDTKMDMLDDVALNELIKEIEIETEKQIETAVVSEIPVEEYTSANQNSFNGEDLVIKDQNANMLENVQHNSENEKNLINEDSFQKNKAVEDAKEEEHEEEKTKLKSIFIQTEATKNSSEIDPDQELSNNNAINLDTIYNNTQSEVNQTSEITETKNIISGKEEQVKQTISASKPIEQFKIADGTDANSTDADGFSVEKVRASSEIEIKFTHSIESPEDNLEKPSNAPQESGENIPSGEILKDHHPTETDLYVEDNKRNISEIDAQKVTPNYALENSKTDDSANNDNQVGGETRTSFIENTKSVNLVNQQDISNEVTEEVPFQQQKEHIVQQNDNINSFSTESLTYHKETTKIEPVKTDFATETTIDRAEETPANSLLNTEQTLVNTIYQAPEEIRSEADIVENINPTTFNPKADISLNTPLPTYQDDITTNVPPPNDYHDQHFEHSEENLTSIGSKDYAPTATTNVPAPSPPNGNHAQHFEHSEENLTSIGSKDYAPTATTNVPAPSPPNGNHAQHFEYSEENLASIGSKDYAPTSTTNVPPPPNGNQAQHFEHSEENSVSIGIKDYAPTSTTNVPPPPPPNGNQAQHFEHSEENSVSIGSKDYAPTSTVNEVVQSVKKRDENTKLPPSVDILEPKENKGLFATIMGTVNNMLTNNRKKQDEFADDNESHKILMSDVKSQKNIEQLNEEATFPYCKNIGPNGDCPESSDNHEYSSSHFDHTASKPLLGSDLSMDAFLTNMASKILEMSELIVFLAVAAAASLFFVFGYYCFCNSSREGGLLLKLNQLESSLLATHKENAILKHNLMSTRQKLASIEDNSFGSNDMVASIKKDLEEELVEKARLQDQITVLQKELENAADAGIELNKIVSELLSNQTGDESIISSVEELQKQLNEQQNTIYEINASLAEKSRENSELQLMIAEQNARYEAELANVQRDNDELEHEKGNLLTRLKEMKSDFDKDITAALEGKNMEIKRLQNDILDLNNKLENEHTKWQTSVAKIEALEECLKNVRKDPKVNISEVINVANVKAQLIEAQKSYKSLKERFETELDSRKLAENQLEMVSAEVEKLKQDFNQSEKDKLEAQTRLEVLSNYFKDKENQLQKELSLKEAMWLKQQGETTTTVDRVTAMQEEIQSLKSQNDSLRAEIEAQMAAHKAQIGTLENRAHETWLAARQSDRRYEEARAEATALRRKLTALGGGNVNESNKTLAGPAVLGDELTQAPSPIHMESPGSPLLGRMPPPPPFLPPPFMGPPPPFMGMPPPPPFVPPGEMRPAPLGRIMSPPPQRSGRFSPQHLDYEDYLDYEGNNTWHRYTYSPPPRTYRSLSPTDSRYNYGTERDLMSTFDTETDFSPPPSPRESRRWVDNSSERMDNNNTKTLYGNAKNFNSSNKGPLSSGSEHSFNTHSHSKTKTKKGNATVGGKNFV